MQGGTKHLRRLSAVRSGKNIKFLTPAVYSGGWCPMRVACNICEDIGGLSYLMVGMPECATYSRGMSALPEGPGGELRRIYTLDANEVVFGCREGLMGALRVMAGEGAKAVLMIATCVTDLIGEDMEGLISEMRRESDMRLSYVTLGQFKNFGSSVGTWKTAEALVAFMDAGTGAPPAAKKRANAIFIDPWRNKNDVVKYPLIVGALEARGVEVRKLTSGAGLAEYAAAPDAALNLALSELTQPMAARMQAEFGVPYAPLHNSYSVAQIDKTYADIAGLLEIEPISGQPTDGWRDMAAALEERAKKELAGVKYAMLAGNAALSVYLAGFGMEPLIVSIGDFHNEDAGQAKQLKALGYDPPVCRMMNIDYDMEVVRGLGADIIIGGIPDRIKGFRCVDELGDFFGVVGYERTAGMLSRIFNVLETGDIGDRMDMYGLAPRMY